MPRIKSIPYDVRPSEINEPNKKYFFALEGVETEVKYLNKLINTYKPKLAQVFYFYRNKNDGNSNIKKITQMLESIIDGTNSLHLVYESAAFNIYNLLNDNSMLVSLEEIEKIVKSFASGINKKYNEPVDISEIPALADRINTSLESKGLDVYLKDDELEKLIKSQTTYDPELDTILIIGDRDKKSFTDEQYDYVIKAIKTKNINLYITNPCIEFWFLLHFTDAKNISEELIEENQNEFVLKELKKFDSRYSKKLFNADYYISNIDKAIKNASNYCNNVELLKNHVGTNLNELYKFLKKDM